VAKFTIGIYQDHHTGTQGCGANVADAGRVASVASVSDSNCGVYNGAPTIQIAGNDGKTYTVVKIASEHLVHPATASLAPDAADNTMLVETACKFAEMALAASAAGVTLKIDSGFRTLARQQYFWNCYKSKKCNDGNLAAWPGTSNHGKGIALDLNTDCGRQSGSTPPVLCTTQSPVYKWLRAHANDYGFKRGVEVEPWHWEYRPNDLKPAWQ